MCKDGDFSQGIDTIIRDEEGVCLAMVTWKIQCGKEARHAKCMGLKLGLALAKDLLFLKLEVESDYLELIYVINQREYHPSQFHVII